MLYIITGGSASGKSSSAEAEAMRLRDVCGGPAVPMYYIAAMQPYGEEGAKRVAKHRAMREGKGFLTIERYDRLETLELPPTSRRPVILLECMSNLTANEQFSAGGTDEEILQRIVRGIRYLEEKAAGLVVVTNEVFSDGCPYEGETLRYIRLLGRVNAFLAAQAERITEVIYGIPVRVK